jgi:integrative and conjugative element protein (TIGR02256 family)
MLQWFKKNPEFLRQESTALANDSNYKELYQCRDNLFISHGNIIVRLNEVHRFPILIVYTDATPYQLPMIFPLQCNLSNKEMDDIASLILDEAVKKIKTFVEFYYDLRHQNNSGELCILEKENLDSGSLFFGITTILQRIRDWYAGHITQTFPPDSEEVDFSSHFNYINNEIRLLYPEHFLHDQFIEGECYATLYNFIPRGRYFEHDKYLYLGSFLDGIGKNGLFEQVRINLDQHLIHKELKTSLDIYNHPEIVNNLVTQRFILKSHWFHIEKEPKPFRLVKDLVIIIGNGNYDYGIKRINDRCQDTFKKIPDSFLLGIRFPNRKGINEFQLFKIYKSKTPPLYVIQINAEERMRNILDQFEEVEAIEGEKLTETTFHLRNSKRADYKILKKTSVNVFGVGAIGSEIADCMAKAGTGKLLLFDNQTLKAHNAVRHLAGLEHIGKAKIGAVAEILSNHNPFITIGTSALNLFQLDVSLHLEDGSITVSSVADDNVEGFVNQQLVIGNRPAFYVRALRGGKAARIFRVIPGKDACFNCLSLYRNEGKEFIEIPEDPDNPTLKNECNNPIRPASAADLKFIASFASRILIDYLQNDETDFNHWIWSSEAIRDTLINTSNHIYSQHISPHINCIYCHHDRQINVFIPKEKVAYMQELISQNPRKETGGVIVGWTDEKGDIIITDVSGPGPKALCTANKFEKDVEYCQLFLDELYIQSFQKKVYVGEWHSHPISNNNPSGTDIKSLSEISLQKEYLTDIPIMIIFSNTGNPSCTVHPAGTRYYQTNLERL